MQSGADTEILCNTVNTNIVSDISITQFNVAMREKTML